MKARGDALIVVLVLCAAVAACFIVPWASAPLATGTIAFWVFLALVNISLVACAENERWGLATAGVIGTIGLLHCLSDLSLISLSLANPAYPLVALGAYLAAGTIYTFIKWYCYVKSSLDRYQTSLAEFKDRNHIPQATRIANFTPEQTNMFMRNISPLYAGSAGPLEVNPKVADNKGRIYMWIMFWPWSAVWTFCVHIINDPIKRLCNAIYNSISGCLQRISDRIWAGTDLPPDNH